MSEADEAVESLRAFLTDPASARATVLLGEICPKLPRRLLAELASGGSVEPLGQDELIELVYQPVDEKDNPQPLRRKASQPVLRARLRKLQQSLNNLLKARGSPMIVVRPRGGWLFLWDTTKPNALEEARSACDLDLDEEGLVSTRGLRFKAPKAKMPNLAACFAFLDAELKDGPRESNAVKAAWKGAPHMLRKARQALKIKAQRLGGRHGKWFIAMQTSQNT
jgi:hypothetical protein